MGVCKLPRRKNSLSTLMGKGASVMDHKTLGEIFQEISEEFSEMEPTDLDRLEDKVLDAMYKLGSYLMESKIADWNTNSTMWMGR